MYKKNIINFASCGKKKQQLVTSLSTIALSEISMAQLEIQSEDLID